MITTLVLCAIFLILNHPLNCINLRLILKEFQNLNILIIVIAVVSSFGFLVIQNGSLLSTW